MALKAGYYGVKKSLINKLRKLTSIYSLDSDTLELSSAGELKVIGGSEGTTVEGNPQDEATDTLTKIKIDSTVYDVPDTTYSEGTGIDISAGNEISLDANLDDLNDVVITNVQDGQILQYDATSQKWVNESGAVIPSKTITVYSAANDTLTYSDLSGIKTVTTDANGEGTANIVWLEEVGITFVSSVAKNPNNLSQAYSKTVIIGANTTEVYVMPDNTMYWYGYENCTITPSNYRFSSASSQFIAPTVTKNTNSLTLTASSSAYGTVWFTPMLHKANLKVNTIVNINMGSQNMLQVASQYVDGYTEIGSRFRPSPSANDQYGYSEVTTEQDEYVVFANEGNTHFDIKAVWYE